MQQFWAHEGGVTAVSWAPAATESCLAEDQVPPSKQFATGGADRWMKAWTLKDGAYHAENVHRHSEWVRDVAWAPASFASREVVASCSEDGAVLVHVREGRDDHWRHTEVAKLTEPAWHVSWSAAGSVLAVSAGQGTVRLYQENAEGRWEQMAQAIETGTTGGSEERIA